MYKALCAIIALVMLVVFLGPVSATAPADAKMPTVIFVAPADDKREKDDNIACFDRYCTEVNRGTGPPADLSVAYSQENNYCATQGTAQITQLNVDEHSTLQNTGPPEDCCPKPICGILLAGVYC